MYTPTYTKFGESCKSQKKKKKKKKKKRQRKWLSITKAKTKQTSLVTKRRILVESRKKVKK
jgi:hypothetical protein